ncbi:MAG: tRNA pseudouridine synthase A [Bacteroidota bacterium]
MMPRYFIHLCYDGTNYSGWQFQANAPSVQETINKALHKLLQQTIRSTGCGRTDAGVHAKDFYMHFDAEKEIADLDDFLFRLNCVLPYDISVFKIFRVEDKAHTRFHATERTYEYYVYFDKTPFIQRYAYYQGFYRVDWEKVLAATEFLKTIQDFTSLCLASEDFKTNICSIKETKWDILPSQHLVLKPFEVEDTLSPLTVPHEMKKGEVFRFTITSNRFLRGMVRKIVGTALMVGKGKIGLEEFKDTVANKKDFRIHYLAPPQGLFLSKIKYPDIG